MINLQKNVSLKDYSNFKIGGNAKFFCKIHTAEELLDVLKNSPDKKVIVIGGATNILFSDAGFDGLVIKNSIDFISHQNDIVTAGAGVEFSKLLDYCTEHSLSGLEWAGGLPGTVGGAVRGNAGAYGGETKDNVAGVESIDLKTLKIVKRGFEACEFGYRQSIFKKEGDEVITSVKFKLQVGDKEAIKTSIQAKIDARELRHPLDMPNIGSIFQNVPVEKFSSLQMSKLSQYLKKDPFPVIPTAKLVYLSGLMGKRVGDAQISQKHTNFIVNLGNAKSEDVKTLMTMIEEKIKIDYGVELIPEVMFVD